MLERDLVRMKLKKKEKREQEGKEKEGVRKGRKEVKRTDYTYLELETFVLSYASFLVICAVVFFRIRVRAPLPHSRLHSPLTPGGRIPWYHPFFSDQHHTAKLLLLFHML